MKDAKGHGSDPRGAHSQGVQAVGHVDSVLAEAEALARATIMNPAKMVPIDSVRPTKQRDAMSVIPANDEWNIQQLRDTIRQGNASQIPPLYVSDKGAILDGNHRYYAFKEEGVKTIPVQTRRKQSKAELNAIIKRLQAP
jgi:hypothetical protein